MWKQKLLDSAPGVFDTGSRAESNAKHPEEKQDKLYQKIGQLNVEIDWLKKKWASVNATLEMKKTSIDLNNKQISQRRQCNLVGLSCSNHWIAVESFRAMFPKVNLQSDKLLTDENGIYTNGGAYSFLKLIIYLEEKYFNRVIAIFCSKVFQIEMDRKSQYGLTIFKGQKMHGDEMEVKAQAYIESNLREKISIESLSSTFAVGRRNFDRRFIKATGNTPGEYSKR